MLFRSVAHSDPLGANTYAPSCNGIRYKRMRDDGLIPQLWCRSPDVVLAQGTCLVSWPGCLTPLWTVAHFDPLGANPFMLNLAVA